MSTQGGLRHTATEPSQLDSKRERRRGAAGRAAVLRRAPSDSDCSGETASLSADSGDRVVRPAPPVVRSGKSRSRRRGSEWEVLEGLKDGQRFDRRPEVFNGYLHKKRKWPLKGWHKRFFVVDGGILVYARSPTDVARGRLHGSVDVGLSVISAKARRRRIDIDADEFIYHLRAKTQDVFRTWLNVLKVHRLYRQHLLTFGARESVPKIHAPLEDLPPTEASSRTSSVETSMSTSTSDEFPSRRTKTLSSTFSQNLANYNRSSIYLNKDHDSIKDWLPNSYENSELIPLNFEPLKSSVFNCDVCQNKSLCSMNCVAKRCGGQFDDIKVKSPSLGVTDTEKQIHSTVFDENYIIAALNAAYLHSALLDGSSVNMLNDKRATKNTKFNFKKKTSYSFLEKRLEPTTAMFFFGKNKANQRHHHIGSSMKKSKKCTNLVKYRNLCEEPPLKKPLSRNMLLGKYKLKLSKQSGSDTKQKEVNNSAPINEVIQIEHKSLQDAMTASEYDKITEKLMVSLFDHHRESNEPLSSDKIKYYVDQIVRELYDIKLYQNPAHPVKTLFRTLLEYWLKNTSVDNFRESIRHVKSIDRQSNKHFTKDQNLSSAYIDLVSRQTQYRGHDFEERKKVANTPEKKRPPLKDLTESYEKERRIQELERLLKNTVYICETVRSNQSKEKDIKITKKLIDNLEKYSKKSVTEVNDGRETDSSTEIPKIQETINHLISETFIPAVVAKEFLGAYLDVLLNDNSRTTNETSASSIDDSNSQGSPECDVQTESVLKKVSKSITTVNKKQEPTNNSIKNSKESEPRAKSPEKYQPVDPGQLYLKDIIEKITTLFSKTRKSNSNSLPNGVKEEAKFEKEKDKTIKDELGRLTNQYPRKDLIFENHDDNFVVIDLSKYDLEHISMFSDPAIKGMMSITMKLKEKPQDFGEMKRTNLNLKFSDDNPETVIPDGRKKWLKTDTKSVLNQIPFDPRMSFKNPYVDLDQSVTKESFVLNPYYTSSDASSKAYCKIMREREHSLDSSIQSSDSIAKVLTDKSFECNDETQSCYMMSSFKKSSIVSKLQNKKVKECSKMVLNKSYPKKGDDTAFDNPIPRIIDEKFILMLLENLTLLSKSIPGLHKDINSLYLKLKKKHEKIIKITSNAQGVGLLGKIYNEEKQIPTDDNETQFEVNICPNDDRHKFSDSAVNTTYSLPFERNCCHKSLSAHFLPKETRAIEAQTEPMPKISSCECKVDQRQYQNILKNVACPLDYQNRSCCSECKSHFCLDLNTPKNNRQTDKTPQSPTKQLSTHFIQPHSCSNDSPFVNSKPQKEPSNNVERPTSHGFISETYQSVTSNDVRTVERADTVPNWSKKKCTRDCSISTAIKCILDPEDNEYFRFVVPKRKSAIENELPKRSKNERKQSPKVRQDLIKEIKLLSPSFKVSTLSQTDKQIVNYMKSRKMEKDFGVYQLLLCNKYDTVKSVLMTDSSLEMSAKSEELKTIYRCTSYPSYCSGLVSPTSPPIRGPQAGFVSGTPGGRLASWIIESGGPLENASRELGQAQLSVQQLQRLLDALEMQHQHHHDTDVSLEGASPNVKKDRRKFGLRKKKSNSKCASVELAPPPYSIDPSSSLALSALTAPPSPGGGASSMPNSAASLPIACAAARPQSLPGAESLGPAAGPASLTSLTPDQQLREDFTVLAKDLLSTLKGVVSTLVCERGRLRAAMDAAETTATPGGAVMTALRTNLTSALQQNSELRTRLSRIHDASDLAEISSVNNTDPATRQFQQSLSYSSSCVSASEFFDAEEHEDEKQEEELLAADEAGVIELDGDSSSEAGSLSSEEGSASSDNSEVLTAEQVTLRLNQNGVERPPSCWTRRTRLPCPRPTPGGPSLWNLLYKNIGKDLSLISMPVTINEPLNMLQRLCEELEYSELLDTASECHNAVERMALIAAFAVSAYSSSAHRAASKPFNPLLAETYECVRSDRAFSFIAEQVSHHPPISACHAESPRWVFWQEARIKTKFWGKSMEFQPTGRVHVRLASTGDHYSWNKVTTCVHNLFGGQRWVDQYGDMHITCHGTDISCKLNFIKASSWSSSRHEVRGAVTSGGTRLRLQGRWSEALYAGEPPAARCLWRPGAMPPEHELYYGFTRFAMELNELEPGMKEQLPYTDTRLRPDQRALEEGDVDGAEQYKHSLEQAQRDRRRDSMEHAPAWFRKAVEGGEETWVFTEEYWKAREAGFPSLNAPRIW